jgi:hypothetical protein
MHTAEIYQRCNSRLEHRMCSHGGVSTLCVVGQFKRVGAYKLSGSRVKIGHRVDMTVLPPAPQHIKYVQTGRKTLTITLTACIPF